MNGIDKIDAALLIIEKFAAFLNTAKDLADTKSAYLDRSVLEFSEAIQKFLKANQSNEEAIAFAEGLCFSFDKMNRKYNLSHDSLVALINKIKIRLEEYK